MGPSNAIHTVCIDTSHFGLVDAGNGREKFDSDTFNWQYDELQSAIIENLTVQFPSLQHVGNRWIGKGHKVILENSHCEIGTSFYNDINCWWMIVKDDEHYHIHKSWCEKVEESFRSCICE